MAETKKVYMGTYVTVEEKRRMEGLARAVGLTRAEFMRRSIKLAAKHLDEIEGMGVPDDPRKRWRT